MDLREYLTQNGITQRAFAARCGVSAQYLSQLVKGERVPSLPIALRISDETGGAVDVAVLAGRSDSAA